MHVNCLVQTVIHLEYKHKILFYNMISGIKTIFVHKIILMIIENIECDWLDIFNNQTGIM